jgi:hypothetical protein
MLGYQKQGIGYGKQNEIIRISLISETHYGAETILKAGIFLISAGKEIT